MWEGWKIMRRVVNCPFFTSVVLVYAVNVNFHYHHHCHLPLDSGCEAEVNDLTMMMTGNSLINRRQKFSVQ